MEAGTNHNGRARLFSKFKISVLFQFDDLFLYGFQWFLLGVAVG